MSAQPDPLDVLSGKGATLDAPWRDQRGFLVPVVSRPSRRGQRAGVQKLCSGIEGETLDSSPSARVPSQEPRGLLLWPGVACYTLPVTVACGFNVNVVVLECRYPPLQMNNSHPIRLVRGLPLSLQDSLMQRVSDPEQAPIFTIDSGAVRSFPVLTMPSKVHRTATLLQTSRPVPALLLVRCEQHSCQ